MPVAAQINTEEQKMSNQFISVHDYDTYLMLLSAFLSVQGGKQYTPFAVLVAHAALL